MTQGSRSVPVRVLTAELVEQLSDLVSVEIRLLRSELSESSAGALSGTGWLAAGLCFLLGGLVMLLAAAAALLMRLGMHADLACLVVSCSAMLVGTSLAAFGVTAFKNASFVPARSLRQIASLGRIVKGT
jgi:hypothetical protein